MVILGYTLSSEEHRPATLVDLARRAETAGFEFASVSDHYHPWTSTQGQSPFVWTVLGALAEATDSIRLGTGVTCPFLRVHPAIVAQAAATAASLLTDRFFLGLGTGELLNEHVVGGEWPPYAARLEMLEESIEGIRRLFTGDLVSYRGDHVTVEQARLYTVPDDPPPIYVAASGARSARAAGRLADGLISTAPDGELVDAFLRDAADSAPRIGQLTVCWDHESAAARRTAHRWWPNSALPGQLGQDLPTTAHFEHACSLVDEADVVERVVCGPDVDEHIEGVLAFEEAGFTHVYVHQVGPNQAAFLDAYEADVLPAFG